MQPQGDVYKRALANATGTSNSIRWSGSTPYSMANRETRTQYSELGRYLPNPMAAQVISVMMTREQLWHRWALGFLWRRSQHLVNR